MLLHLREMQNISGRCSASPGDAWDLREMRRISGRCGVSRGDAGEAGRCFASPGDTKTSQEDAPHLPEMRSISRFWDFRGPASRFPCQVRGSSAPVRSPGPRLTDPDPQGKRMSRHCRVGRGERSRRPRAEGAPTGQPRAERVGERRPGDPVPRCLSPNAGATEAEVREAFGPSDVPPRWGSSGPNVPTQGGARASLALGWLSRSDAVGKALSA